MTRPRCYNRPPVDAVRVRHGISDAWLDGWDDEDARISEQQARRRA